MSLQSIALGRDLETTSDIVDVRVLTEVLDEVRFWHRKEARSRDHFAPECNVCTALKRLKADGQVVAVGRSED